MRLKIELTGKALTALIKLSGVEKRSIEKQAE